MKIIHWMYLYIKHIAGIYVNDIFISEAYKYELATIWHRGAHAAQCPFKPKIWPKL